ncbi:sensor histidine kinase [Virgibacillus necropolis]|uniref:Signal transduction histidine-protein kinase/phosphatase DegS n=1 Tax=Virgibacillus necropolis TaxID=163877 RepID=A0A221MAR1_9BACI|nr:sensor histidine kinase [Virgibacillus necropolis]ASN04717.1 histidine kinase [Virgibacillus necropolis]
MVMKTCEKALDGVIDEMVEVVEHSKDEIFNISEESRKEYELLTQELLETKTQVIEHISNGDKLEQKVRFSRKKLSEVSKYFERYSETEIRKVYENTHAMQTDLAMIQQQEKALRARRDDLERRLLVLDQTIERAEGLAGKITVILTYLNDDFKQVNELIEDAKEKHEFGLKIIEAQEEERRKISREIHDGPAQMLANILLRSEIVDRTFRDGDMDHVRKEISNMRKMIRTSLYEVRRIIYDLRPMALDDLGLVPTLKKYIANVAEYTGLKIEFVSIGNEQRFNQKYEVAFFRLVQEAVQNSIKHAEASHIVVKLEIKRNYLMMIVKDNGRGFDPNIKTTNSFGLIGMRERVDMLEGTFKINSIINEGTAIFISVPHKE